MKMHGVGVRLSAILLSGLALGSLGLLEPLVRFWDEFYRIGLSWPVLIGIYLGTGLAISIVAGICVSFGLATMAAERRPIIITSYFVGGTIALAAVVVSAPLIRRELEALLMQVPYGVIFAVLTILAVILTTTLTPHIIRPLLSSLIGYPSGRISQTRLTAWLVLIFLLIPLTIHKSYSSQHQLLGRSPRKELTTRPSDDQIQNILLITIDALRADHLSCMGYERSTSPAIDSLAAQSMLFKNCFAQGNQPLTSLGSIFTSLYPGMHSLRDLKNLSTPLPNQIETLAELMRDAGLQTTSIINNTFINRQSGIFQGFDEVDDCDFIHLSLIPARYLIKVKLWTTPEKLSQGKAATATGMTDQAIDFLIESPETPFFMHLHFFDTHYPFSPPEGLQHAFRSPGSSTASPSDFWDRCFPMLKSFDSTAHSFPRADLLRLIDLYDGTIRYVDNEIRRLLRELDRLTLGRNTAVIITGTHGEEFLEHDNIFHKSPRLYDEVIHVPLIIYIPELGSSGEANEIVRHIDIMPTLMEIIELPLSSEMQGQSLLPLLLELGTWSEVAAYSQSYEYISIRTDTLKVQHDLQSGNAFCFDLAASPAEEIILTEPCAPCDSLENSLLDYLRIISLPPGGTQPASNTGTND